MPDGLESTLGWILLEPINATAAVVVVVVTVWAWALGISAGLAELTTRAPRMSEERRVRGCLRVSVCMGSRSDRERAGCSKQAFGLVLRSCRLTVAFPVRVGEVLGSRPGHYPIDRKTP
jgi:hypothetical protein